MKTIIILLCFITIRLNAQNYKIGYLEKIDLSNGTLSEPFKKQCFLLLNEDSSLFSSFNNENTSNQEVMQKDGNRSRVINRNDTLQIFKNKVDKVVITDKKLFTSKKIVLDSLGLMKWELSNEQKTILGYNCYKATTKFRGREFEVFYTAKIPISDGPRNFYGLPGVILYVKLMNSIHTYEIEAISITNSNEKIKNPFKDIKTMSFEDFKKLYKKKHKELGNYSGGENVLSKGGLENLIDE